MKENSLIDCGVLHMVKNKDIAIKAGVSVATVSRVMNQSGYVKKETKDLVMNVYGELAKNDKDAPAEVTL